MKPVAETARNEIVELYNQIMDEIAQYMIHDGAAIGAAPFSTTSGPRADVMQVDSDTDGSESHNESTDRPPPPIVGGSILSAAPREVKLVKSPSGGKPLQGDNTGAASSGSQQPVGKKGLEFEDETSMQAFLDHVELSLIHI